MTKQAILINLALHQRRRDNRDYIVCKASCDASLRCQWHARDKVFFSPPPLYPILHSLKHYFSFLNWLVSPKTFFPHALVRYATLKIEHMASWNPRDRQSRRAHGHLQPHAPSGFSVASAELGKASKRPFLFASLDCIGNVTIRPPLIS